MADYMDAQGYRPGMLWAPVISATQLIGGPLLALGLFTRLAAVPIVLFLLVSNIERWRVGKYFWNQLGLEYTLMWTVAAFYFLVHGGGAYSLDALLARPRILTIFGLGKVLRVPLADGRFRRVPPSQMCQCGPFQPCRCGGTITLI